MRISEQAWVNWTKLSCNLGIPDQARVNWAKLSCSLGISDQARVNWAKLSCNLGISDQARVNWAKLSSGLGISDQDIGQSWGGFSPVTCEDDKDPPKPFRIASDRSEIVCKNKN